tara:strand:- start:566 stop:754 length:189 start_codon:yes stop_codon:yes gene_type:complete
MRYTIVQTKVIEVTKEQYIKNRKEKLNALKAALKQFKIKTTKEINIRQENINEIEILIRGLE